MYRPLERFWPYADFPSSRPTRSWRRCIPSCAQALFGAPALPFSISIVFPEFDGSGYARAVELARASDEYLETQVDGVAAAPRAVLPGDRPLRLRDLYEVVADVDGVEVLVDDQPVPYARELWLPLVWFLIRVDCGRRRVRSGRDRSSRQSDGGACVTREAGGSEVRDRNAVLRPPCG